MAKNDVLPEERVDLLKQLVKDKTVKIVFLDTETSINLAYLWTPGEQYVSEEQMKTETRLMMAQYMFEGDKKAQFIGWNSKQDDTRVLKHLAKQVFSLENLIMVGQNQKAFDLKTINDRLVKLKLHPIPFQQIIQIDILQTSRAAFKRPSHSLDYRSRRYGLGGKYKMERADWIKVLHGDKEAFKKMATYGLKDPEDTRGSFWRELPYYQRLPASIEKLMRDQKAKNLAKIKPIKLFCKDCAKRHQSRFEIVEGKRRGVYCINCNKSNIGKV